MKTKIYLLFAVVMLCFASVNTKAANAASDYVALSKADVSAMTVEQKQARLQEIKARITEIKSMDKSNMTSEQKKELRVELRGMRKQAGSMGGGVYLSVGAIIIVILLLILIIH